MKAKKSKFSVVWLVAIFLVAVLGMVVWTSLRALRETPTRQVTKELSGQGWVTFNLTTSPYPPKAKENISLELTAMNRNNVALNLGQNLPFTFGEKGSQTPLGDGIAVQNGYRYQTRVQFPVDGNYWMSFDLGNGNLVEFQIIAERSQ